jgi:DNA mismatch endonuclease (patch repair protein)
MTISAAKRFKRLDPLTPHQRSERMRRIRSKNTSPERKIRQLLYAVGLRYRLHLRSLPGIPDIVFQKRRKVIFIHGCFWHLHSNCTQYRLPKTNRQFWMPKLRGNRKRDKQNLRKLRELGWNVMVIWECEMKNSKQVTSKALAFLR